MGKGNKCAKTEINSLANQSIDILEFISDKDQHSTDGTLAEWMLAAGGCQQGTESPMNPEPLALCGQARPM